MPGHSGHFLFGTSGGKLVIEGMLKYYYRIDNIF